jgi:hypothetical protein
MKRALFLTAALRCDPLLLRCLQRRTRSSFRTSKDLAVRDSDVTKLAPMDGPIPGVGPWQTVLLFPGTWHFSFLRHACRTAHSRTRTRYLDGLWDRFAFHPERMGDAERAAIAALSAFPTSRRLAFIWHQRAGENLDRSVAFPER